ncbi:MAG: hypothetical protein ABSG92_09075 [Conexivisphaerales archaeon]
MAFALSVTTLFAVALLEALEIDVGDLEGVTSWAALAVFMVPTYVLLRRSVVRKSALTESAF